LEFFKRKWLYRRGYRSLTIPELLRLGRLSPSQAIYSDRAGVDWNRVLGTFPGEEFPKKLRGVYGKTGC
jgi:hypothetical protein